MIHERKFKSELKKLRNVVMKSRIELAIMAKNNFRNEQQIRQKPPK
jgi:hypothetical protein